MKLVNPSKTNIEFVDVKDNLNYIFEILLKSYDCNVNDFLEYVTVYLKMPITTRYSDSIIEYCDDDDTKVVTGDKFCETDLYGNKCCCYYITTNLAFIQKNDLLQDLYELSCPITEYHKKRQMIQVICDRVEASKIIRDKTSYSLRTIRIENYISEGQLCFIIPEWSTNKDNITVQNLHVGEEYEELCETFGKDYGSFLTHIYKFEESYFSLIKNANVILPKDIKNELYVVGYEEDLQNAGLL